MMETLIQTFSGFLAAMGPIGGMGWLLSVGLGYLLFKEYREENARVTNLQAKLEELQKMNADIRVAAAEERVEDLKDLLAKYDTTSKAIISALKKIGNKS